MSDEKIEWCECLPSCGWVKVDGVPMCPNCDKRVSMGILEQVDTTNDMSNKRLGVNFSDFTVTIEDEEYHVPRPVFNLIHAISVERDELKKPRSADRPEIKQFFPADADLKFAHNEYTKAPHLFKYAQALDNYIDENLEQ